MKKFSKALNASQVLTEKVCTIMKKLIASERSVM